MTITKAEYERRMAGPQAVPVLTHRGVVVGDVFNPTVVPAPVGGPVIDEHLMVRLRREAVDEALRLRGEA